MGIFYHIFISALYLLLRGALHGQNHFVNTFVISHNSKLVDSSAFQKSTANPEEAGPYFQGDIILPAAHLSGRVQEKYRWENRTIHYEFDKNYPSELQSTFLKAVDHITSRTCLKFLPRQHTTSPLSSDYIWVTGNVSNSCYSNVGRQGGKQVVSLPKSCNALGTFVHELLHAIGFHHEQSRSDRDDHVQIIWDNVQPGKNVQFRKYDETSVSSFGVPYDYGSVMHYSKSAFSKNSKLDTIVPLVSLNGLQMGQRKGMSQRDIEKVNNMYGC